VFDDFADESGAVDPSHEDQDSSYDLPPIHCLGYPLPLDRLIDRFRFVGGL